VTIHMQAPPGTFVLDVSEHQGPIDWPKVAAWRSPDGRRIVAVVARATYGTRRDSRYLEYRKGAKAAGLLWGAYGVLLPAQPVPPQVQAFIDTVGEIEPDDLPPALDFEVEDGKPGGEGEHRAACEWVALVEAATQRRPLVYTGRWFWQLIEDRPSSPLAAYPLWVASYTARPLIPRAWKVADLWQYSGDVGERVDGIRTAVDRDVLLADTDGDGIPGTEADLRAFIRASHVAQRIGPVEVPRAESPDPAPVTTAAQGRS